jgi:imidazolonepropionase
MPTWDSLWTNVNLATMAEGGAAYGAIENGALAIKDGRIAWGGAATELPHRDAGEVVDGAGGWLTPGLIDCHTHLVFAGDRSGEFEQRLKGVSYAEIARAGGGIARTVAATRQASHSELEDMAARRLACLRAEGVTTVEIKSGYGLDRATEIKMLEVARGLGKSHPVDVRTTFLGAHALPREFANDRAGYLDLMCTQVLPEVAERGLADAVDAFCESIAFTPDEVARVFQAARALGLPVKLHADQLSDLGGAALAARFGALSADHLEYAGERGVQAMAAAGTVAVLLPGAFYTLREPQQPPVELLRRHGVPIALATDCNPGSSPILSILAILNMACTLFGLTPEEALAGG